MKIPERSADAHPPAGLQLEFANGLFMVPAALLDDRHRLAHFAASRHTVREGLRVLTEEGLIARRPRAGSIVIATTAPRQFTQRISSVHELLNYPNTVRKSLSAMLASFLSMDSCLKSARICCIV